MIWLIVLTTASLASGLAESFTILFVARGEGLGTAGMISVTGAIIRSANPTRTLGRGLGLNAFIVGLAVTIGPMVAFGSFPWRVGTGFS